ncbi:2770_t:CDS:2 [Entrophospora sp. SA101]|nr:2770_t:CDS:2 [Entrophospora sp. SA101]
MPFLSLRIFGCSPLELRFILEAINTPATYERSFGRLKKSQAKEFCLDIFPALESLAEFYQDQHHLVKAIWGENFSSPVHEKLKQGNFKVLDIGCGSGTWACDLSSDYQSSNFIGIDHLKLFPDSKPNNVEFMTHKCYSSLPFEDDTFDFVHFRFRTICYTIERWENFVIKELVRILKPGGYLEIYDAEINCNNMSPLHSEFYSRNLDPLMIRNLGNIMASSKLLEDIHHEHKTIPVGEWDGVIGE